MKNKADGLDLFVFIPDYFESEEESEKRYREEYKKFYGEYPKEQKEG